MCGIAEFRCKNLRVEAHLLDDVLSEFTYSRKQLDRSHELVSVEEYHSCCLCDPSAEERQQFYDVVATLVRHADKVVYSPNDYSDNPTECFEETWSIAETVERYWPSLETPPLRVTILPE